MQRSRTWRTAVATMACCLVWLVAGPAAAQDAAEVADALAATGAYVEDGAAADPTTLATLAAALRDDGHDFGFVVLVAQADDGTDQFADAVLDAWGVTGTVVVLSPEDVFAASDVFSSGDVDDAFDASIDAFRSDAAEGFTAFADALTAEAPPVPPTADEGADGGFPWGLAVVGLLALAIIGLIATSSRRASGRRARELEEARGEIREQLTVLGELVFDLDTRVTVSGDAGLEQRYEDATATFQAARDEVGAAADHVALAAIAERVDRARWQLESVAATLDGRPAPPEPTATTPAACFFDPTHRAATEEATVRTPAGTAEVRVCTACAERLRVGEAPRPREVAVRGTRVPAGRAPRSHGGSGLEWLGGMAEVLLRGSSRGTTVDMGGPLRAPRPGRRRPTRRATNVEVPPLRSPDTSARTRTHAKPSPPSRGRGGRRLGGGGERRGRSGRKL